MFSALPVGAAPEADNPRTAGSDRGERTCERHDPMVSQLLFDPSDIAGSGCSHGNSSAPVADPLEAGAIAAAQLVDQRRAQALETG